MTIRVRIGFLCALAAAFGLGLGAHELEAQQISYMRQDAPRATNAIQPASATRTGAFTASVPAGQSPLHIEKGGIFYDPTRDCDRFVEADGGIKCIVSSASGTVTELWTYTPGAGRRPPMLEPSDGPIMGVSVGGHLSADAGAKLVVLKTIDGGTPGGVYHDQGAVRFEAESRASGGADGGTVSSAPATPTVSTGAIENPCVAVVVGGAVTATAMCNQLGDDHGTTIHYDVGTGFLSTGVGPSSTVYGSGPGDDPTHGGPAWTGGVFYRQGEKFDTSPGEANLIFHSAANMPESYGQIAIDLTWVDQVSFWDFFSISSGLTHADMHTRSLKILDPAGGEAPYTLWSSSSAHAAGLIGPITLPHRYIGKRVLEFSITPTGDYFVASDHKQGTLYCACDPARGGADCTNTVLGGSNYVVPCGEVQPLTCVGPCPYIFDGWRCDAPCLSNCGSAGAYRCLPSSAHGGPGANYGEASCRYCSPGDQVGGYDVQGCTSYLQGTGGLAACYQPPTWTVANLVFAGTEPAPYDFVTRTLRCLWTTQQGATTASYVGRVEACLGEAIYRSNGINTGEVTGGRFVAGAENNPDGTLARATPLIAELRLPRSGGHVDTGTPFKVIIDVGSSGAVPDGGVRDVTRIKVIDLTGPDGGVPIINRPVANVDMITGDAPLIGSGGSISGTLNWIRIPNLAGVGAGAAYAIHSYHTGPSYLAGTLEVAGAVAFDSTLHNVGAATFDSTITITPFTSANGLLRTNASGLVQQFATGTAHQLLHGNDTWALIDLTSEVTGRLPYASVAQGSALSVLGVTGNATADNASIVGTANQALRVNGAGTALAFGALDVSQSAAVTGRLAYANLAQGSAHSVLGVTGNATADNASISGSAYQVMSINSAGTGAVFGAVDLSQSAAVTGNLAVSHLNSGTSASSSTCWYGDATWKTCGSGGAFTGSGTDKQLAFFTGATAFSSNAFLTLNSSSSPTMLGVGTTPSATFHAKSATAADWGTYLENSTSGGGAFYAANGTGEGAAVTAGTALSTAGSSYAFLVQRATTPYLYVHANGSVLAGESSAQNSQSILEGTKNQATPTAITVTNTTSGSTAFAYFRATAGTNSTDLYSFPAGYSNPGTAFFTSGTALYSPGTGGLALISAGGSVTIFAGGTASANAHATVTTTGLNSTPIGATTTSTGAFTTLSASSLLTASNALTVTTGTTTLGGALTVTAPSAVNLGRVAITQATSITTGVTAAGASIIVTTVSATTAARTCEASFTVTDSAVAAASSVVCSVSDYSGTYWTNGFPMVTVDTIAAGSFKAHVCNVDATNALSGTVKIHCAVL